MKFTITTLFLCLTLGLFGQSDVKKEVEELPRFYTQTCEQSEGSNMDKMECSNQALMQFIINNLKYPKAAKAAKIEGKAMVQFVVSKEGTIKNIEVKETPNEELGAEAVRVLNLMNEQNQNWIAGIADGKKVDVQLMLPFTFKL